MEGDCLPPSDRGERGSTLGLREEAIGTGPTGATGVGSRGAFDKQ